MKLPLLFIPMIFSSKLLLAHSAHVHGVGELNVAIDNTRITFAFESPAESIYGFETEAKTPEQKREKDTKLSILKNEIGSLLQLNPDLGCSWKTNKVEVVNEGGDGHLNVESEWLATCKKSPVGSTIKFNLSKSFPRLKTLKVNVLKESAQSSATIKSGSGEVVL